MLTVVIAGFSGCLLSPTDGPSDDHKAFEESGSFNTLPYNDTFDESGRLVWAGTVNGTTMFTQRVANQGVTGGRSAYYRMLAQPTDTATQDDLFLLVTPSMYEDSYHAVAEHGQSRFWVGPQGDIDAGGTILSWPGSDDTEARWLTFWLISTYPVEVQIVLVFPRDGPTLALDPVWHTPDAFSLMHEEPFVPPTSIDKKIDVELKGATMVLLTNPWPSNSTNAQMTVDIRREGDRLSTYREAKWSSDGARTTWAHGYGYMFGHEGSVSINITADGHFGKGRLLVYGLPEDPRAELADLWFAEDSIVTFEAGYIATRYEEFIPR